MKKEESKKDVKTQKKKDKQPEYSKADLELMEKIAFKVERITLPLEKNPL